MQIPPRQRLFVIVLCAKPTTNSRAALEHSLSAASYCTVRTTYSSAREKRVKITLGARALCNLRCTAAERAAEPSRRQALAQHQRKENCATLKAAAISLSRIIASCNPPLIYRTQSKNFFTLTSRPQPVNCRVWKTAGLAVQNDRVLIKHRSIFGLHLPHGCNCKSNRCTFVMIKYVLRTNPVSCCTQS